VTASWIVRAYMYMYCSVGLCRPKSCARLRLVSTQ